MKKIILTLILLSTYLFSGQIAFGGPSFKYTILNGQNSAFLLGARGGAYINEGFFVGAELDALVSDIKIGGNGTNRDKYIGFGYGGILVGTHITENLITTFLLGAASISFEDTFNQTAGVFGKGTDAFVGEIGLEYKLVNTSFGASYRFLDGWTDLELTETDLSFISVYISFDFGKLNFKF